MKKIVGILGLAALVSFGCSRIIEGHFGCSKIIEGQIVSETTRKDYTLGRFNDIKSYSILDKNNNVVDVAIPRGHPVLWHDPANVGDCVKVELSSEKVVLYDTTIAHGEKSFSYHRFKSILLPEATFPKELEIVDCKDVF